MVIVHDIHPVDLKPIKEHFGLPFLAWLKWLEVTKGVSDPTLCETEGFMWNEDALVLPSFDVMNDARGWPSVLWPLDAVHDVADALTSCFEATLGSGDQDPLTFCKGSCRNSCYGLEPPQSLSQNGYGQVCSLTYWVLFDKRVLEK